MIKASILYIYSKIFQTYQSLRWLVDIKRIRKEIKYREISLLPGGRYLILIPHADDEWVGCSQVMNNKAPDVVLFDMDMGGGDSSELHARRKTELKSMSDLFKIDLQCAQGDKIESLCKAIKNNKPDTILVPYYMDWHPEHIQVMDILRSSVEEINYDGSIMMYQVSVPIIPEEITCRVPMDRYKWRNKWALFQSIYKSQTIIPYKRFAAYERINGKLCNSYAAEVYKVLPAVSWTKDYLRFRLSEEEKKIITDNLSNLIKTRVLLRSFFMKRTSAPDK